jgi:LPS-assembly protein
MTGREFVGRCGSGMHDRLLIAALLASVVGVGLLAGSRPAEAQTLSDMLARKANGKKQDEQKDKLLVESKELVYDRDKNTISASGDAQLYYQGRVLEADKVTFDRNTNRVYAEGNAKLTETDGQVAYGDRFDLTGDFKEGFIDSLRVKTNENTRLAAPRAERTGGETTVFDNGTYTACLPCADDPSRPPVWQVRAKRIIHKNQERMIYYEDATLEFGGIPVAYVPYFSAPDSTVKRKSGFLAPRYIASTALGTGVSIPYFWALAPNYDMTITPTLLSRQGVLGNLEWRHRLMNGSYLIRGAGIFQQDQNAFLYPPYGPRGRDFRGSLETAGQFFINEKWKWGWDVKLVSDKWFLSNYKYRLQSADNFNLTGFKEAVSTIYMTGKGDRSWFDARGYYFQTLSYKDWQKIQPEVLPSIDYDRRFQGPAFLGGELALSANLTHIQRSEAAFQSLVNENGAPGQYLFPIISNGETNNLYDTCAPNRYNRLECLVKGFPGDYTRGSVQMDWRRTFIDPLGQSWTPFGSLRADLALANIDSTGTFNQYMPNFTDTSGEVLARVMPAVGGTYRYPFVANSFLGESVIEPIGQIIVRPNETQIGKFPNEDAQSLVMDDTTLFSVSKFSGYDRVEGGTRANVGAQYTLNFPSGGNFNALFGESFQLAGRNSYNYSDLSGTGRDAGLSGTRSDYVARAQYVPNQNFSFTARTRLGESDFSLQRLELESRVSFSRFSASLLYANYAPQPALGKYTRQEGIAASAQLFVLPNWFVAGGVYVDLGRQAEEEFYYPGQQTSNKVGISRLSLGGGYRDECTTFTISYSNSAKESNSDGTKDRDQTVMVRLELRTLGAAGYSYTSNTSDSNN